MSIDEYIPEGYRKRISRKDLALISGFDDRDIRDAIAHSDKLIISADGGYFIPKLGEDEGWLQLYILQENARIKTLLKKQKSIMEKVKRWMENDAE